MKKFVMTDDWSTAELLRHSGFVELNKRDNMFVFMNNGSCLKFSEDQLKKLTFTNVMCM